MFEMLQCTPVPQFAVGMDNRISFWNKSCELLTGYPAEMMLGTDRQWEPFYKYKRPVLADLIVKNNIHHFLELYSEQEIAPSEIVPQGWEAIDFFTDLNGRACYVHFLAAPFENPDGKIIGAVETLLEVPVIKGKTNKSHKKFGHNSKGKTIQREMAQSPFSNIIGNSPAMMKIYQNIANAAVSDVNVIIYGESGTGKELVAKAIHDISERRGNEFVAVNCGAIPESLIESEFFGYKKGAFSDAVSDKPGFLDRADGGTLFLDEIGEMSQRMQVKLLRALEGGGFSPVGSTKTRKPDLRFIGATKKNLMEEVKNDRMREDFFYRIHILPIRLSPLRERKEDIPFLTNYFVTKYGEKENTIPLPKNFVAKLIDYPWPGNVRELENAIHRYLTLKEVDFIEESPPMCSVVNLVADGAIDSSCDLRATVAEVEKKIIIRALENCQWQRNKVASSLKISRKTLFRKMKKFGLL